MYTAIICQSPNQMITHLETDHYDMIPVVLTTMWSSVKFTSRKENQIIRIKLPLLTYSDHKGDLYQPKVNQKSDIELTNIDQYIEPMITSSDQPTVTYSDLQWP